MKTGLILEGGAMRGMFTCGVLDVWMEQDITFDGAAGISAGAVFGCNFKSRQIGRPIRYNKKYCADPRYGSIRSLMTTGDLYGVDFCYRQIPDELDVFDREAFRDNPMEFYIGATSLQTGKAVFHKCTDGGENDMTWMRASASMPLVSRPVQINGSLYLDGGIADSVPYLYMEKLGYDRNVIILTQPEGYVKEKSTVLPAVKLTLRKYPNLVWAMENRHRMYNNQMKQIKKREEAGTTLVIRPSEALGISRIEKDPQQLERVYQMGRKEGQKRLEEVKAFLS
ncbi:MAG: patatin family protein [Lachnospiraceae bacterium]|nr:patatin family protein [Lachnospiraceae bacterium]